MAHGGTVAINGDGAEVTKAATAGWQPNLSSELPSQCQPNLHINPVHPRGNTIAWIARQQLRVVNTSITSTTWRWLIG